MSRLHSRVKYLLPVVTPVLKPHLGATRTGNLIRKLQREIRAKTLHCVTRTELLALLSQLLPDLADIREELTWMIQQREQQQARDHSSLVRCSCGHIQFVAQSVSIAEDRDDLLPVVRATFRNLCCTSIEWATLQRMCNWDRRHVDRYIEETLYVRNRTGELVLELTSPLIVRTGGAVETHSMILIESVTLLGDSASTE